MSNAYLPPGYQPCSDPACELTRMPAYPARHWHYLPWAGWWTGDRTSLRPRPT